MARTGLKLICWMESRALGSKMSVDLFIRISGLKDPLGTVYTRAVSITTYRKLCNR